MKQQVPGSVHASRTALAVLALAALGCSGSASSALVAEQGVAVTVKPTTATVGPSGHQLFAATVTGALDTSVTWHVPEGCGTISAGGLYTAPAVPATCAVVAVSNADKTRSAAAAVTVEPGGQGGGPTPTILTWEPLKIGAGGFITGIDIDPTGATYVIRTDTYGAYVGDGVGAWTQVVRADTMPASSVQSYATTNSPWFGDGVYEIRVAPTNASRLYMIAYDTIWRSDNRGTSWTQAGAGYATGTLNPNGSFRLFGQKMAVDPANADIVYAASTNGLYRTTNGGASWSLVATSSVPASVHGAYITGIAFDPGSGTTGGKTNTVYATSNGNGVYRSIDAGASWSLLSGGPTIACTAHVAADGSYYVANDTTTFYRWTRAGSSWTSYTPQAAGRAVHLVVANPANPKHLIAGSIYGYVYVSTDGGSTWTPTIEPTQYGGPGVNRDAADIPWLATANEIAMSTSDMIFDPVAPNKLWFAEGIGVWTTTAPTSYAAVTWESHSRGIEQLVAQDVLVPPGSSYAFTAGWDRSVFRTLRTNTTYPSDYVKMGSSAGLIGAWALDCSHVNPQHLVALINGQQGGGLSGYSLDGGASWAKFPVQPATGISGDIIAPSIDNIIAIIGIDGRAYRSTNRGTSWALLPGVPGALHDGIIIKKHVLAVDGAYDGVTNKTLYLYAAQSGTWRSTDDGVTWARVSTFTMVGDYYHVKLRSVPGQAGHLFLTVGQQGSVGGSHPWNGTFLYRSTDGGATWTKVPGIGEPWDVALGAAAPGASYPTIYVVGWYDGVYGIWRSVDDATTWTQLGPFTYDSLDLITVLKAATDVYGEIYVGFQGSGWAKGNLK